MLDSEPLGCSHRGARIVFQNDLLVGDSWIEQFLRSDQGEASDTLGGLGVENGLERVDKILEGVERRANLNTQKVK